MEPPKQQMKPGQEPAKHGNETTYGKLRASENKVQYIVPAS
jgi:hypothetical protein